MGSMRPALLPWQGRFGLAPPLLSLLPGLALRSADATTVTKAASGYDVSSAKEMERLMHQGIAMPRVRGGVESSTLLSASWMPPSYGGLATAHAVSAAVEAIDEVVQQKVDARIEERVSTLNSSSEHGPSSEENRTPARFSDETVRTLMQQMDEQAQDELFRSGKLR
jgi:hypothetical protein